MWTNSLLFTAYSALASNMTPASEIKCKATYEYKHMCELCIPMKESDGNTHCGVENLRVKDESKFIEFVNADIAMIEKCSGLKVPGDSSLIGLRGYEASICRGEWHLPELEALIHPHPNK